jgi:hypothetical protein
MQPKRCPGFVEGKACDRPLTPVDLEAEKIARYNLVTYECGLGHRTLLLDESKARPLSRDEKKQDG